MYKTSDLHVVENRSLSTPAQLHREFPIDGICAAEVVAQTRDRIRNILSHEDPRLLVIVGPCSIHDVDAALDYGTKADDNFEPNSRTSLKL